MKLAALSNEELAEVVEPYGTLVGRYFRAMFERQAARSLSAKQRTVLVSVALLLRTGPLAVPEVAPQKRYWR